MNSKKIIELKAKAIIAENAAKSTIELYYTNLKNENERLHSIIKEVREIMKRKGYYYLNTDEIDYINSLLDEKILDKEEE